MKKAILLVTALAFCVPASPANAVCVRSEGGSVRVDSGSCPPAELLILDQLDQILDRAVCLVDDVVTTSTVSC